MRISIVAGTLFGVAGLVASLPVHASATSTATAGALSITCSFSGQICKVTTVPKGRLNIKHISGNCVYDSGAVYGNGIYTIYMTLSVGGTSTSIMLLPTAPVIIDVDHRKSQSDFTLATDVVADTASIGFTAVAKNAVSAGSASKCHLFVQGLY